MGIQEHGNNLKGYTYTSPRKYVVGHRKSIEPKISNFRKTYSLNGKGHKE